MTFARHLVIATIVSCVACCTTTTYSFQDEASPARAELYDVNADAASDINAALERAGRENRRVLVQWGAEWCGWCHKLSDLFKDDRAIARLLRYEYDLVRVDVGRFDHNIDLVTKYGAQLKKEGIPYLTILAPDGSVLANQETGALEEGPDHDPAKVLAFLEKYKAPPRSAKAVAITFCPRS